MYVGTCRQRKRGDYMAVAVEVSDLIQRHRVKYNLLFPSTYNTYTYMCTMEGKLLERVAAAVFEIIEKRTMQQRDNVFPLVLPPPRVSPCGLQTHTHTHPSTVRIHVYRYIQL